MKQNPRQLFRLLAILISGVPVLKATANGFALPDQDAFATARGEAVTATADNPSAIYYNPAGITQLGGHNLRAGFYAIDYNSSYQPPNGVPNAGHTYKNADSFVLVPRFFYSFTPTNFPLSFGLGIYAPFGGKTSWPQDTGFRSVALNGELKYITINPVVAWKILPSLSIAAGPMVNYVDMNLNQGLDATAAPFANHFRFTGTGWSVGYNLGARWQPLEQLAFGATFRSPAKVTLDGQTQFELEDFRIPPSSSSANMDLNFPMSAVGGVSYRPTPRWNLELDVNYTDWSSFSSTTIHQSSSPSYPLQQNIPVALNWQPSWMYEFGATRYFDNRWNVSAGYVFSGNSVPNDNYTPLAADMDRHFFSIGTGYQGQHLSFDLAYQLGYGPTHTVTGSKPSTRPGTIAGQTADGQYGFNSSAVSVSLGWHF